MRNNDRCGYVVLQLSTARAALREGDLVTARGVLRRLRTTDFFGGATYSEAHFAVLRDLRSSDDDVRDAAAAILRLRPIGLGGD